MSHAQAIDSEREIRSIMRAADLPVHRWGSSLSWGLPAVNEVLALPAAPRSASTRQVDSARRLAELDADGPGWRASR
ncbi:hypothetical protein [Sorangium cellulosum]|uniref:hypothetical protein n=1 Tax=Sorangium cellulosum TaxID=56 RepID=UPI000CF450E2|nr:hypothetical protein [Sorangium cellulosum]